ncbi:photosystem II oxygen-evolving enhancer protein 2 [Marchantia polymorpha subsp. ruderalis]|nr:hypothetical protein MARPO_0058s0006 [Marchantia polymorpha]BBN12462.1 hypothetical protein Mp_5g20290 [Marchantia polymorpha subsp. ruderalis]|eukprot:PTQ37214.1 hypothetical protein MARPO_0058s0006 [Marchantia polymorpha]
MAASATSALSMAKVAACPANLASSRSAVSGTSVGVAFPGTVLASKAISVNCRASAEEKEVTSRRSALALLAGLVAVGAKASPALAAYGESANVFGTPKVQSGFTTYSGEGFTVDLPSKWNPSKEKEFPGQVLRYEDNFDQLSNLSVSIVSAPVKSIKDYGSPEKFLSEVSYLLGKQSYDGQTASEGGFDKNAVATASIFTAEEKEVNGKTYYNLEVLTRTGDGNEGGRHQCIVATVDNGKLYIFKAQAGDKRWFKGSEKFVHGAADSFTVA